MLISCLSQALNPRLTYSALLIENTMPLNQPEISWPDYASYVNALSQVDTDYEWLAKFFSHNQQSHPSEGHLNILESHEDIIEDYACSLDDLHTPPRAGVTRIVILSYKEIWALDRKVLDKVALTLNLSPYFLWQHLEYRGHHKESAFPGAWEGSMYMLPSAAASEVHSLEIGSTQFLHMSAMIAFPATSSTGPVGWSFTP